MSLQPQFREPIKQGLRESTGIQIIKKNIDCLRPDSKSQVTVKYLDNEKISSVDSIIISTQHDDFSLSSNNSLKKLRKDLKN